MLGKEVGASKSGGGGGGGGGGCDPLTTYGCEISTYSETNHVFK